MYCKKCDDVASKQEHATYTGMWEKYENVLCICGYITSDFGLFENHSCLDKYQSYYIIYCFIEQHLFLLFAITCPVNYNKWLFHSILSMSCFCDSTVYKNLITGMESITYIETARSGERFLILQ